MTVFGRSVDISGEECECPLLAACSDFLFTSLLIRHT